MTLKGWHQQVSPDGRYLAWGKGTVRVFDFATGAITVIGPGWLPTWINGRLFYFVEHEGVFSVAWPASVPVPVLESAKTGINFRGTRGWGLFQLAKHTLIANGTAVFQNQAGREFVIDGGWWACVSGNENQITTQSGEVWQYPAKIRQMTGIAGAVCVRLTNGKLYWNDAPIPHVEGEGNLVPILVGEQWWRASTAGTRVLLRPVSESARAIIIEGHGDAGLSCVLVNGEFIGASQDAKGIIRTFAVSAHTDLQPIAPEAPAPDVPAFSRHFWAACYKDPQHQGPGNCALVIDAEDEIPLDGPLVVSEARLSGLTWGRVAALYIEAENDVAKAEADARALRALADDYGVPDYVPTVAYLGELVPSAPIPGVDVVLLQGRYLPETPEPVVGLAHKYLDARAAGLRCGVVLDATDGVFNGMPSASEDEIARWQRECVTDIVLNKPEFVFWWAWSRKRDTGPERGLSGHPQALAWVKAIVAAIPPLEGT